MSFRLIASCLATLLATTFFVGCDDDSEAPSDSEESIEELTFAFQPQENPEGLELDADNFGEFIEEKTGYKVDIYLPTNYSAVVEALRGEHADVAYFSGLPYMMAHEMAGAELLVVEERDGNPHYYSQWYTLDDTGVEDLADLKDRPIAFTSHTSTSGYLFPMAEAIDQGLIEEGGAAEDFFGEVIFAGGYEQALRALVNGQVEGAAASNYALELYLSEEERENVRILSEQGPVPTHGLAIRGDLPEEVKTAVRKALLALNEEEHSELLQSVYGAERLVEQNHDDHVQALDHAYRVVDFDGDI